MAPRLKYAKIVDSKLFYTRGAKVHPGLDNVVLVDSEPGTAAAFLVMRAWTEGRGTITERWRIDGPGGITLYESSAREVHLPTPTHVERLDDEVDDLHIEQVDGAYTLVVLLEDSEVARVPFEVRLDSGTHEG